MRKLLFLLLICLICVGCQDKEKGLVQTLWELEEDHVEVFQISVKSFWKSKKEIQYYFGCRVPKDKAKNYEGDWVLIERKRWEEMLNKRGG